MRLGSAVVGIVGGGIRDLQRDGVSARVRGKRTAAADGFVRRIGAGPRIDDRDERCVCEINIILRCEISRINGVFDLQVQRGGLDGIAVIGGRRGIVGADRSGDLRGSHLIIIHENIDRTGRSRHRSVRPVHEVFEYGSPVVGGRHVVIREPVGGGGIGDVELLPVIVVFGNAAGIIRNTGGAGLDQLVGTGKTVEFQHGTDDIGAVAGGLVGIADVAVRAHDAGIHRLLGVVCPITVYDVHSVFPVLRTADDRCGMRAGAVCCGGKSGVVSITAFIIELAGGHCGCGITGFFIGFTGAIIKIARHVGKKIGAGIG